MKKTYLFWGLSYCLIVVCMPLMAQPTLMGLTGNGGQSYGTIFSLPTGGTSITQQFNLNTNITIPGATPPINSKLTQADNGKLYGFVGGGGEGGILFEYDPLTNSYTKKVEFNFSILVYFKSVEDPSFPF